MIAEAWAKKLKLSDVTFISGSWLKARKTHFVSEALQEFAIDTPSSLSYVPSQKLLEKADLIVTIYDSTYEIAPHYPETLQKKNRLLGYQRSRACQKHTIKVGHISGNLRANRRSCHEFKETVY
nr:hypothetical protein [Listeria aquatica]